MPMITTFTPDDLILYYYGELDKEREEELSFSMLYDSTLEASYNQLKDIIHLVDISEASPSQGAIEKILQYSRGK